MKGYYLNAIIVKEEYVNIVVALKTETTIKYIVQENVV
jgi:hypothetical protein